ncbi:MAG: DNA repair protein RecO [Gammaproteobacteria bacterium]|nr:DNA repair protein RecO [Gammaproteobacteria bacterium]
MNNQIIDNGFILHRYPYRETSVILECFLQHHGRISIIAKGVRTERSPLKGLLQPFTPLHFNACGKSQLKTLTLAETVGSPILLKGVPLMSAWYMNELLMRLLPKEEHNSHLYFTYHATLLALENANALEKSLRIFEKNLLEALGYELPLTHDANSRHAIIYDHYYQFVPEHGFIQAEKKEGVDIFIGEDLQAIANDQFANPKALQAAKRLMRLAIRPLLGGKPLKTRELLSNMSIKK